MAVFAVADHATHHRLYETRRDHLSASDAGADFDRTGYTNAEKYANGLMDGSYPT